MMGTTEGEILLAYADALEEQRKRSQACIDMALQELPVPVAETIMRHLRRIQLSLASAARMWWRH